MDNIPEVKPTSENIEIPENWQFAERKQSAVRRVIQVDRDEGYLALYIPPIGNHMAESIDYFFSRAGLPLVRRKLTNYSDGTTNSAEIEQSGELQVKYELFDSKDRSGLNLEFMKFDNTTNDPKSAVNPYFWIIPPSGSVHFNDRGTVNVALENYRKTTEPNITFFNRQGEFIKKDWSSYRIGRLYGIKIMDQDQPNKLVFVNNQGKKEYVVVWDTVMEEDREGKKVPFFVVTQSHFDADNQETRKILRSPISIDMEKVKSAVLSKAPYPKDEKGRVVVPWRNIDRIVGASLSYSYPPPNPQK